MMPGAVGSIALSNDSNCLLASCLAGTGRLTLLEKASGEVLNSYVGHTNSSYHVGSCFTNTDAHVVSGSEDGHIVFWDLVEVCISGVGVATPFRQLTFVTVPGFGTPLFRRPRCTHFEATPGRSAPYHTTPRTLPCCRRPSMARCGCGRRRRWSSEDMHRVSMSSQSLRLSRHGVLSGF